MRTPIDVAVGATITDESSNWSIRFFGNGHGADGEDLTPPSKLEGDSAIFRRPPEVNPGKNGPPEPKTNPHRSNYFGEHGEIWTD